LPVIVFSGTPGHRRTLKTSAVKILKSMSRKRSTSEELSFAFLWRLLGPAKLVDYAKVAPILRAIRNIRWSRWMSLAHRRSRRVIEKSSPNWRSTQIVDAQYYLGR